MKVAFFLSWLGLAVVATASPWPVDELKKAPISQGLPDKAVDGVQAVFIDGPVQEGRKTRVFAYYGIPKAADGGKVPAMVLVHGGGGSAFASWVKLWMDRGYAAISMDTCGAISGGGYRNHPRHEMGGPPGWGGFDQITKPLEDQWTYHAVSDVMLAHSWIRAQDGVDADRTGITGISWGGYLTCIAAGVDDRFKFAAPVYGCGFLTDNSAWLDAFAKMGPENKEKWRANWDPSVHLPQAKMPMLWVTGTNDFAFPMDSLQRSYQLPQGDRFLAIRPRMPHGHGAAGEAPAEILAMADAVLKGGPAMAKVALGARHGRKVSATWTGGRQMVSAALNYTTDEGPWQKREWKEVPTSPGDGRVEGELPEGTKVYYFNLQDGAGLVASSEHGTL
jgi:dienelactone hydrolase